MYLKDIMANRRQKNDFQKFVRRNSHCVKNHIAMKHTSRLIERFKAIKPGQSLIDVWDTHGAVKRGTPTEKSTIKFSQNNLRVYSDKPAPTIAASFQSNFVHPFLNRNFTNIKFTGMAIANTGSGASSLLMPNQRKRLSRTMCSR